MDFALALLIVRLIVGALFIGHGAQKLFGIWGGGGIEGTTGFMESLGLRPPRVHAILAGVFEFVGGVLLVLGLLTPLAALMIISTMAMAILTVHIKNGPWVSNNGYEYNLVLIALLFLLSVFGAGKLSLDYHLGLLGVCSGFELALVVVVLGVLGALIAKVLCGNSNNNTDNTDNTDGTPKDSSP